MKRIKILHYISIILLIVFGLITLFLSSSIILDLFGIRAQQGNYVIFVVWANFICSILYLFSAYGFLKVKKWTKSLLGIAFLILFVSFIWLKVHISNGGLYETKTVGALIFRASFTAVLALIATFTIKSRK